MTRFWRDGHYRTSPLGTEYWVEGHWVERFDWERSSSGHVPSPPRTHYRLAFTSYESFTIPNARCPVCSSNVFFYQSPYGGRVFFDELGVPWPKHGCTDTSEHRHPKNFVQPLLVQQSATSRVGSGTEKRPDWEVSGWIPIRVVKIVSEDDWYVLKCNRIADGTFFRLLVQEYLRDVVNAPTMMSVVDDRGFGTISYLDECGEPAEVPVYNYSQYFAVEPWRAEFNRRILKQE